MKVPEKVLKRRYERLGFFLFSDKSPEALRKIMGPQAALLLLDGLFESEWQTLRFVISRIIRRKYSDLKFDIWLWWHRTVLCKSAEELVETLEKEL